VEGMGRINFAQALIDRKGITDRVTLNGMTLMNWDVYGLPMKSDFVQNLPASKTGQVKEGEFFKGTFTLATTGDTYLDMTNFKKGMVWVNGHNLGRYWEIGPQKRLYCPAPWLKKGENVIIVLDQHQLEAATIKGEKKLD
jgi:beta-galactosidase